MAYGCAYSIVGDFHLAQDIAQDAFVEAYRHLSDLRTPEAFPGWFRRIVLKCCDRTTRRKVVETVPLNAAREAAASDTGPAQLAEQREIQEQVIKAIRSLPEHQRMVTTLFYINGYSQGEIAGFLDVPVTTVKKRLHDSRKKLRGRMIGMVKDTLSQSAPDERFSKRVIAELLGRPEPLKIESHPVRKILDIIRAALPDYEMVSGEEIVDKSAYFEGSGNPDLARHVYHVDAKRVLRTATTFAAIQAVAGRTPPVHILTAGRVFRPDDESTGRLKVFHQLDALSIASDATRNAMMAALRSAIEAVLGEVELGFAPEDYPCFKHGTCVTVRTEGRSTQIAGAGMIPAHRLRDNGFDPRSVSGFAFGLGLERLAMVKYGIDDIRTLWQPPYVP